MTEKRFWCLDEYGGETSPIVDGKFAPTNGWLCDLLNELHDENIKIKKNCSRTHKEYAELIDCVSDLGYSVIIRNGKVVLER